jgi:DNA modification methylase
MKTKEYPSLSVVYLKVEQLRPSPNNPRTHSKRQIEQIANSIGAFGFLCPLLVDKFNNVLAGHGRLEAAKVRGMKEVPVIRLEDLSPAQCRAFTIADNRLAENSDWDPEKLAAELGQLLEIDGLDFDVSITGFHVAEIDLIFEEAREPEKSEDPVPEPNFDQAAVTELGGLWILGKHRILCANSLADESYKTLLGERRAAAVFTDPPFNIKIHGNVTGNGAIHHREFQMASGEMTDLEFAAFLDSSLNLLACYSAKNSIHYICIDWRHVGDLIAAGKQNYDEFMNLCVWVKDNGGMGSFYRSQHELVAIFRNGKGPHRNNIQLGRFGRNRTNVWQYPGVKTFSKQGDESNLLALHPTVKPIQMVADAILDSTARGEVVLDSFLGSGTTLMAAERVGRVSYGIEIDPLYVDVAIRRWQSYTGQAAIHALTGQRFDQIAAQKEVRHG